MLNYYQYLICHLQNLSGMENTSFGMKGGWNLILRIISTHEELTSRSHKKLLDQVSNT